MERCAAKSNGKELVILGPLLRDLVVEHFKHDEAADVVQEPVVRQQPLNQRLHTAGRVRFDLLAVDRLPRRIPFEVRRPHPVQRRDSVRDHGQRVEVEHLRNVVAIVADLVERVFDGRLLVVRILQLEQHERQSVDEQHDVGTSGVRSADRQLIDDLKAVGFGMLPIDGVDVPELVGAVLAIDSEFVVAARQQFVECFVAMQRVHAIGATENLHRFVERCFRQVGIAFRQRLAQHVEQHHFIQRPNQVRAVRVFPAEQLQPLDRRRLEFGFCAVAHEAMTFISRVEDVLPVVRKASWRGPPIPRTTSVVPLAGRRP